MASIGKGPFNIDGLTIHLTLNILVQKSLLNLLNLSSDSLNTFTCRYEQLQLEVINQISFVSVKMFNIINTSLRFIKHIQNKLFGGVDVIRIADFYQTPLVKHN